MSFPLAYPPAKPDIVAKPESIWTHTNIKQIRCQLIGSTTTLLISNLLSGSVNPWAASATPP